MATDMIPIHGLSVPLTNNIIQYLTYVLLDKVMPFSFFSSKHLRGVAYSSH